VDVIGDLEAMRVQPHDGSAGRLETAPPSTIAIEPVVAAIEQLLAQAHKARGGGGKAGTP
jgi:hypothetical protein